MSWLRTHRRSAWICGLTLLVPLLLYLNALLGLWGMRHAYQSDIDYLEPRIARLRGLVGHESQLRDSSAQAKREVVKLVYPVSGDRATVAATLQTSVRQILSDAGLSVSNSQVLPVREEGDFDYIGIRLTVAGDLAGLDKALTGIAQYLPLLLVESLDVRPDRARRGEAQRQTVTATLQLLSLRAAL
jgi:general secretion pathway protein M